MPSAMPPPSREDKSKLHKLALKGSSKTIVEFFDFACNTILFQRGVYPPEDFTTCADTSHMTQRMAILIAVVSRSMA